MAWWDEVRIALQGFLDGALAALCYSMRRRWSCTSSTQQAPNSRACSRRANRSTWSWAPDGSTLAVHIGADGPNGDEAWVGLLHVEKGAAREERFVDSPGGFRAPAWAPAGDKLAYVGLGGGASLLSVRSADGQVNRVASSRTDFAFSWSPDGAWLAFASASASNPALYDGVEVVHPDGTERHRICTVPGGWLLGGRSLADIAARPGRRRASRLLFGYVQEQ